MITLFDLPEYACATGLGVIPPNTFLTQHQLDLTNCQALLPHEEELLTAREFIDTRASWVWHN